MISFSREKNEVKRRLKKANRNGIKLLENKDQLQFEGRKKKKARERIKNHKHAEEKHIKLYVGKKPATKNPTHHYYCYYFHVSFISHSARSASFSCVHSAAESHYIHIFDAGFYVLFRSLEHILKSYPYVTLTHGQTPNIHFIFYGYRTFSPLPSI